MPLFIPIGIHPRRRQHILKDTDHELQFSAFVLLQKLYNMFTFRLHNKDSVMCHDRTSEAPIW